MKLFLRLTFIVVVLYSALLAAPPSFALTPLIISDNADFQKEPLGGHLQYLIDETGDLTIEEIPRRRLQFRMVDSDRPAFGFSRNPCWLKFTLLNESDAPFNWILELSYPLLDEVDLYVPDRPDYSGKIAYTPMKAGDMRPFDTWPENHPTMIFPLTTGKGSYTFYMRVYSKGSLTIPLTAWSPEAFRKEIAVTFPAQWIFYGIMLAMIFYNVMIFFSTRDISHLYLTFFTVSISLHTVSHSGLGFQLFWPESTWWTNKSFQFFLTSATIWAIQFTRSFLNIPYEKPLLDRIFKVELCALLLLLSGIFFLSYFYMMQAILVVTTIAIITMIVGGVILYSSRAVMAKLYISAWGVFILACISGAMRAFGFLPSFSFITADIQVGLCIMVLLLSFGLGARFKAILREKNLALNALRESDKKYKTLVDWANDGIVVRVEDQPIYANRSIINISGYTEDEFYAKKMMDFFPATPMGKALIKKRYRQYVEGKEVENQYEAQLQRKSGEIISVIISDTPITIEEQSATLSIITDISGLKKAEAKINFQNQELMRHRVHLEEIVQERTKQLAEANNELKKAITTAELSVKEARSANEAKSTFLANMSHEIRTPMNAIIGVGELIMRTELTNKQKEYLGVIRSSSKSLLQLINDILDFSKIDAGKLEFEYIPFRIREIVDSVTDMFLEKSLKKDLELIVDIEPDVPAELISDPLRLRQILANLTSNAFKFTSSGEICITISVASKTDDSAKLLFSVRDTGIGIQKEIIGSLFDAFRQADDSTTRKFGGTGLGLAICKNIVGLLDGEIWVESTVGEGSTFFFTGIFKTGFTKEETKLVLPQALAGMRALIVEDNPSTAMVIKRFMSSFGFRAEVVESGEAALKAYEASINDDNKFNLIIMDIKLPGIDGIQAVKLVKTNPNITPPPIIMISACGDEAEMKRAETAGLNRFLLKPVKQSSLFDTIMDIFGYKNDTRDIPKGADLSTEYFNTHFLLVEDNPINQMVAIEILSDIGITIDKATNGQEAVEMVRAGKYDAVLMDVQMPVMDGLEATRIIRTQLKKEELPIIAMTAHAMYGDKERCLEAGMSDYIPKPIDKNELFSVIRRNVSHLNNLSAMIESSRQKVSQPCVLPGIDLDEALYRMGGSWESFNNILKSFSEHFNGFANEFRKKLETGDIDACRIAAHSVKGVSANISAHDLQLTAAALEKACASADTEKITVVLNAVEDELDTVLSSIEKIMTEKPDSAPSETEAPATQNVAELGVLLKSLDRHLAESDPVASESVLTSIRSSAGLQPGSTLFDLLEDAADAIGQYCFDDARKIINVIAGNLKKQH